MQKAAVMQLSDCFKCAKMILSQSVMQAASQNTHSIKVLEYLLH